MVWVILKAQLDPNLHSSVRFWELICFFFFCKDSLNNFVRFNCGDTVLSPFWRAMVGFWKICFKTQILPVKLKVQI